MKVYCFPGLGADKRMYDFLLSHSDWDASVIELTRPKEKDTLASYAIRFRELIDDSEPFAFIGTSLGGMIAVELSKVCKPKKLVLISSLKTKHEKPILLRTQKLIPLYKLLKGKDYKQFNSIFGKIASSAGRNNLKSLIMDMSRKTDDSLIEWAVHQVIHWENQHIPENLLQIHGERDILFPQSNIKEKTLIIGGSHIMILTHSDQIFRNIDEFLRS